MKLSIRTRLFLGISGLIVLFVAISLLLNTQFLGKYYIGKKSEHLIEIKDTIDNLYNGDPQAIAFQLENLERNRGMNILILNQYNEMIYSSFFRIFVTQYSKKPLERFPLTQNMLEKIPELRVGDFKIDVVKDKRLQTNFLILASRLHTGDILLLSSPIAAINESTAIANRFLLFTGLFVIFLGGIIVFFFAGRFTRPILKLNDIAQGMAKLDFSKKYQIESNDEIGQLGRSINSLSEQLDKAITGLKKANEKLREDIEHERQIDKMRKEFISNVSHELKTPLSLIQGYAEGLKLNVNEDEENKDFYCDVIMDESNKMNKLVCDLLDLSQIESGYFKLEKRGFDISSLVDNVIDKYGPIFTEKGLEASTEKATNIAVNGDIIRIEQVLANLINNALNHVDEKKIIKITVNTLADKVRVSVYNSGKLIPEESMDKIWNSFYKVDKARTRTYGGTGLGLSVVKAIMEIHNNAYGVENQNDGVLFWFELDQERRVN